MQKIIQSCKIFYQNVQKEIINCFFLGAIASIILLLLYSIHKFAVKDSFKFIEGYPSSYVLYFKMMDCLSDTAVIFSYLYLWLLFASISCLMRPAVKLDEMTSNKKSVKIFSFIEMILSNTSNNFFVLFINIFSFVCGMIFIINLLSMPINYLNIEEVPITMNWNNFVAIKWPLSIYAVYFTISRYLDKSKDKYDKMLCKLFSIIFILIFLIYPYFPISKQ